MFQKRCKGNAFFLTAKQKWENLYYFVLRINFVPQNNLIPFREDARFPAGDYRVGNLATKIGCKPGVEAVKTKREWSYAGMQCLLLK